MIFGEDKKGYGLRVEYNNDKILIITRKGNAVTKVLIEPKEARKLAKEIYKVTKEVEYSISTRKRIKFYDKLKENE